MMKEIEFLSENYIFTWTHYRYIFTARDKDNLTILQCKHYNYMLSNPWRVPWLNETLNLNLSLNLSNFYHGMNSELWILSISKSDNAQLRFFWENSNFHHKRRNLPHWYKLFFLYSNYDKIDIFSKTPKLVQKKNDFCPSLEKNWCFQANINCADCMKISIGYKIESVKRK